MIETKRIALLTAAVQRLESFIELQEERHEAEVTRLKEELRPWYMLREMEARYRGLSPYTTNGEWLFLRNAVSVAPIWYAVRPGWIEARYNEWRERFPQEGE